MLPRLDPSPTTALFDLNTKKAVYERFSIPWYWVVVPDVEQRPTVRLAAPDSKACRLVAVIAATSRHAARQPGCHGRGRGGQRTARQELVPLLATPRSRVGRQPPR